LGWSARIADTMHYVYVLRSQSDFDTYYVGSSSDLRRRLAQHNAGQNISTKSHAPWRLIYYEAYEDRLLALKREKQLKYHAKAMTALKKRLLSLQNKGVG
jgi:putative endonuclease